MGDPQGLPQHLVNVLQGGRPGAEGVDHVIHRGAVPVEQGGVSPDGAGADVVAPHIQHGAAVRIVQPLPHAAGQGGGIHELGLVVHLHPQRLQGLAPVSGAEEGLGHVQVKEVDGLAAQFRQCLGEIEGQLAFAAARLAQENNIAAGSHIQ